MAKRKKGNQDKTLKLIILTTATLTLIDKLVDDIRKLIE